MKKEKKTEDFEIIFKELELKNNKEILQFTRDVKIVISQVENQEDDLENISAASIDTNQMYFSTGT